MKRLIRPMIARLGFYRQYPDLGASHLHLLEVIGIHDVQDQHLSVTKAMKLKDVASPATIHRLIDALEYHDLVRRVTDPYDIRVRYLHLGSKGTAYFKKLDKALEAS